MRDKTETRVVFGDLSATATATDRWFYRAAILGPRPRVRRITTSYRGREANFWETRRDLTLWPFGKIPAGSCVATRFTNTGARKLMVVSLLVGGEYVDPPAQFTCRWLDVSPHEWQRAAPWFTHSTEAETPGCEVISAALTGIMVGR